MRPPKALRKHPNPISFIARPQKGLATVVRVLELDERMGKRSIERVAYPNQMAPPEILVASPSQLVSLGVSIAIWPVSNVGPQVGTIRKTFDTATYAEIGHCRHLSVLSWMPIKNRFSKKKKRHPTPEIWIFGIARPKIPV